jgi:Ser/Thr protein kinase RdoA (MazF antagonist)
MGTPNKGHYLHLVARKSLNLLLSNGDRGDLKQVSHISGCIKFVVASGDSSDRKLLSVHYPRPERKFQPNESHLRSLKLFLIDAIDRGALSIPRPIAASDGELVFPVIVESPYWNSPCYCTLTEWIDGDPLSGENVEHVETVAKTMAALHNFADGWVPPDGSFSLPTFDRATWETAIEKLGKAVIDGRIQQQEYDTLRKTAESLTKAAEETLRNGNRWGLIHGDMMPGNLLQSNSGVWIIDFDNSGFGFFAQDVAWVLNQLTQSHKRVFVDTYSHHRPEVSQTRTELEGHFILAQIYYMSWWVNDPSHEFSKVRSLCQMFKKLEAGTPFLYT